MWEKKSYSPNNEIWIILNTNIYYYLWPFPAGIIKNIYPVSYGCLLHCLVFKQIFKAKHITKNNKHSFLRFILKCICLFITQLISIHVYEIKKTIVPWAEVWSWEVCVYQQQMAGVQAVCVFCPAKHVNITLLNIEIYVNRRTGYTINYEAKSKRAESFSTTILVYWQQFCCTTCPISLGLLKIQSELEVSLNCLIYISTLT